MERNTSGLVPGRSDVSAGIARADGRTDGRKPLWNRAVGKCPRKSHADRTRRVDAGWLDRRGLGATAERRSGETGSGDAAEARDDGDAEMDQPAVANGDLDALE